MTQNRILLSVNRFKQQGPECGIAAVASLANFYDSDIAYVDIRKLIRVKDKKDGVWTSQQARMLNQLGFSRVTIISADLDIMDFSWEKLSKRGKIRKLETVRAYYGRRKRQALISSERKFYYNKWNCVHDLINWLKDKNYDNRLVIDNNFGKYIRRSLNNGRPLGASIDWTSTFKVEKTPAKGKHADITGETEDHAFVIRGYDNDGVFIVDSHVGHYRGKLRKYNKGYYKLSWERLFINIPAGDLLLIG